LRDNRFFTESLRQANLARLAYADGDYDLSAQYAEEAVKLARQSDEYIALQLKLREANNAITAAKRQLDQTKASGVSAYFPDQYADAQRSYDSSVAHRNVAEYDQAITAANEVNVILADLRIPEAPVVASSPEPEPEPVVAATPEPEPEPVVVAPEPEPEPVVVAVSLETEPEPVVPIPEPEPAAVVVTPPPPPPEPALPAQYTVRAWNPWRDCLWNIAGKSWAYGDSSKWRLIYEANRSKFPEPNNPNLIHPGMVLDIPSIRGEARRGMWDERTDYPPLR
jgi:nucleoid-associated protein YgaU